MSRDLDNIREKKVEEGIRAAGARSVMLDILHEHEQSVLNKLISQYRGGTLTDENMRGCVGEIVALRALRDTLDNRVRMGQEVQNRKVKESVYG